MFRLAFALAYTSTLFGCHPAFAADVVAAQPTLWQQVISDVFLPALAGLVSIAILYLSALVRTYIGVKIDEKAQNTLHSAVMTGINLALSKYGPALGLARENQDNVVSLATSYVTGIGAPDAVKRFDMQETDVARLVKSKLGAITNASATVAVTTGTGPATA